MTMKGLRGLNKKFGNHWFTLHLLFEPFIYLLSLSWFESVTQEALRLLSIITVSLVVIVIATPGPLKATLAQPFICRTRDEHSTKVCRSCRSLGNNMNEKVASCGN